jgi:hypothetical protein
MQLSSEVHIPDGLLAANALLAENSRLGLPTSMQAPHPGIGFRISSTAMDFQFRCSGIVSDPVVAPNNFTKKYLPPGAQSCSAIFNFHAPPGFDLNAIIAAGRAGGANPFAALRAVGHGGTFDFQRSVSGGNTTFYSGYTDASNIAVGAYLYGAGFSNGQASFISNSFANTMSSNAGSPQQSDYRNLGYDLANAGWNPSCH